MPYIIKPEQMPYIISANKELIEKGFVEQFPENEVIMGQPNYVMTSRPVFRMDKATAKCRIVINASLPDPKTEKNPHNVDAWPKQATTNNGACLEVDVPQTHLPDRRRENALVS